jgi:hypothetical protein
LLINTTQNNKDYSIAGIMKMEPTTQTLLDCGYDGALPPISVARYWLYKFDNLGNDYEWTQIPETAPLRVGLGFTMKGGKR